MNDIIKGTIFTRIYFLKTQKIIRNTFDASLAAKFDEIVKYSTDDVLEFLSLLFC